VPGGEIAPIGNEVIESNMINYRFIELHGVSPTFKEICAVVDKMARKI
jgi:hypothetical protein